MFSYIQPSIHLWSSAAASLFLPHLTGRQTPRSPSPSLKPSSLLLQPSPSTSELRPPCSIIYSMRTCCGLSEGVSCSWNYGFKMLQNWRNSDPQADGSTFWTKYLARSVTPGKRQISDSDCLTGIKQMSDQLWFHKKNLVSYFSRGFFPICWWSLALLQSPVFSSGKKKSLKWKKKIWKHTPNQMLYRKQTSVEM